MNTQGIKGAMVNSRNLLWLAFRHIALAPLVSFVASLVILFPGTILIAMAEFLGGILLLVFVGFGESEMTDLDLRTDLESLTR
jgi:hypothetical protein